ncbi:MAG: hypothetical protein ACRD34_00035 [Bryobacteraceae bacterium]
MTTKFFSVRTAEQIAKTLHAERPFGKVESSSDHAIQTTWELIVVRFADQVLPEQRSRFLDDCGFAGKELTNYRAANCPQVVSTAI